jgi:nitroreductase
VYAFGSANGEPDKAATGLGTSQRAWPAPYWTIDASMSVMTLLLAAEDVGLGALFFGVFRGERRLRQALGVPPGPELLGAIALGYPAPREPDEARKLKGASASRRRRTAAEIIHRSHW